MTQRKVPISKSPLRRKRNNGTSVVNIEKVKEQKTTEKWTIITALNRILDASEDSKLSDEFFEDCKDPLAFLRETLGFTDVQNIVLAILAEEGEAMSWKGLGMHLGLSRLSIMTYTDEIEELVKKRWVERRKAHESGCISEGFAIMPGVVSALRHNKVFVPEKVDNLSEQEFVDMLEGHLDQTDNDYNILFKDDEEWMDMFVRANPHLPLCQEIMTLDDIHERSLLLLIVYDHAQWADSESEGLTMSVIDDRYPEDYECNYMRDSLRNGRHILMKKGLIEFTCDEGAANTECYVLTSKAKRELLSQYIPRRKKGIRRGGNDYTKYLTDHTSIKEKILYYNSSEQEQIQQIADLISRDKLPEIQQRLEDQGMRKGVACLFYGGPGTGKTETVLQIARQTGRDLMQVDISQIRDKFVGESEKRIKEVFSNYRDLCRNCEVMPILFFNEADAIFVKRSEDVNHSVDKMENSIQNIILQEMETLEGIMIATTNLTCNLDKAFERRFLFKVEFQKPSSDVKARIWRSMLKDLSEADALKLASEFDFSGGQIENIARKRTIGCILSGKPASFEEIEGYCQTEKLDSEEEKSNNIRFKHKPILGFSEAIAS